MKIVLTATDANLERAWNKCCAHFECVEVHRGSILDVKCDAVVSPANSYGFMDGGIDLIYSRRFGWGVQERLQSAIRDQGVRLEWHLLKPKHRNKSHRN